MGSGKEFLSYFSNVEVFPAEGSHYKRGGEEQFDWEEEALFQRYKKELEQIYPPEMLLRIDAKINSHF